MQLRNVLWFVGDCFWPRAQPLSNAEYQAQQNRLTQEMEECEKRIAVLSKNAKVAARSDWEAEAFSENTLNEYLGECAKLAEAEAERRQSVEARLTSIMGLSSIAATIVFSGAVAQATGTLHVEKNWLRWIMALGALYLALQLCGAILAAIRGLERQAYLAASISSLFPLSGGEARSIYLRRRIRDCLRIVCDHRSLNNKKVTHMAVAHRAMKNFLSSLLILALLGAYGGITSSSPADLIETLKKNHELHELLRGPQGPPGVKGPKGERGPPGPKGEPCRNQRQSSVRKAVAESADLLFRSVGFRVFRSTARTEAA